MPSSLNGTGVTFNDGSTLQSGNIPAANLGSGTANSNTFLRGDRTFAPISAPQVVRPVIFDVSGTYTKASDVDSIFVMVRGSTGSVSQPNTGGNGGVGGSGYAESFIASPAASFTVTIGAAGTGSGAGGTTSAAGISVTGSGGVGNTATGSAGGVATGGQFNANGGKGGNGQITSFRPAGGGGASGGRHGNGFAGGNGRLVESGRGGGGGGTGGVGGTSSNNDVPSTGGVSTSIVSANVVSLPLFMSPPGSTQVPVGFGAGLPSPNNPNERGGGGGASSNNVVGGYGLFVPQGVGGKGGTAQPGPQLGTGPAPTKGQVVIWEFIK